MATPPVFLPGESHGQGSLEDYSPWGHKESDTTEVTLAHKMIIMLSLVICDYTKMLYNY